MAVSAAQLGSLVFAVDFKDSPPPSAVSLRPRIYAAYERDGVAAPSQPGDEGVGGARSSGLLMGGVVVWVNPDGTLGVLLVTGNVDLAVRPEKMAVAGGVCKFLSHPQYVRVVEWLCTAGLSEGDMVEGTAYILYHSGWARRASLPAGSR
ncbi:hypothetical protein JKF63_01704 [Porcisia hertigi]|uniref:Uncharacterized protein n=1 Tax=Porcisia hertigi TaxID=2761500 RepID=A0A836H578_9TRYP|nr:hypothetical protein JKF63_01704 [Porcisia hertigi]